MCNASTPHISKTTEPNRINEAIIGQVDVVAIWQDGILPSQIQKKKKYLANGQFNFRWNCRSVVHWLFIANMTAARKCIMYHTWFSTRFLPNMYRNHIANTFNVSVWMCMFAEFVSSVFFFVFCFLSFFHLNHLNKGNSIPLIICTFYISNDVILALSCAHNTYSRSFLPYSKRLFNELSMLMMGGNTANDLSHESFVWCARWTKAILKYE